MKLTGDEGIEITPGAVLVDLGRIDLTRMSVDELGEAFAEAEVQQRESELEPDEILGDLDINPL